MPEFADIAGHFDDVPVYDGYSSAFLYNAQFNTFDESSPDGSVVKRRTMSVRPVLQPPARRVILVSGDRWVVGDGNIDNFQGVDVRKALWTKKVTDAAHLNTPGEVCQGAPGIEVWVHLSYMKDTVNTVSDSEYDPFWEVSLSPLEPIKKGQYVMTENVLLRVRTAHMDLNGLNTLQCDQLDDECVITVGVQVAGTFDPVTEMHSTAMEFHRGIFMDSYKFYRLRTDADPRIHSGDMSLVLHQSVDVKVGTRINIQDQWWQVLTKAKDDDSWLLQIRKQ